MLLLFKNYLSRATVRIRPFTTMKKELKVNAPQFPESTGTTTKSANILPKSSIINHFNPPKFVPIRSQTFFCKDSRGDEWNFGAPGGDFGEFLLALDCCFDDSRKQASPLLDVDELFGKWLDERCSKERPFYLHTDRPALDKLFQKVQIESSCNLKHLTREQQENFIELFPHFQGCGHLRLILEDPKSYEISEKLFKSLSRAFFTRYFQGDDRLLFKIYECAQDGKALAVIKGDSLCCSPDKTSSVLGLQTKDSEQIFILNQHAVSFFRKHFLAPFFCGSSEEDCKDLLDRMEVKGWRNAMLSAKSLAGDKPIYTIEL